MLQHILVLIHTHQANRNEINIFKEKNSFFMQYQTCMKVDAFSLFTTCLRFEDKHSLILFVFFAFNLLPLL